MPYLEYQKDLPLTSGGGTYNLSVEDPYSAYAISSSGSVTLSSSWTIQSSGTAYAGHKFFFNYNANITLDGNQINFFGTDMPQNLVNKDCTIVAYYDGSSWTVNFLPSADIATSSVLASFGYAGPLTPGSAYMEGAGGVPSDVGGYIMPSSGFLKSIGIATTLTGTGNNGDATVYIDGVASSLSAVIVGSSAGAQTAVADAADGVAVNKGQRVSVKLTNAAGGPTNFTGTTAAVQITLT